ncbi:PREDICTED: uncharacterized protein LOC105452593 [Wasmannia auropunctata]|uniref:uncharacterized protein LOC105452593 n=1 Tax=Wasmannia auropunctata TaxID=64793 RepID=UPI0005F07352|nr:PREDICTED: uncharacterized protein LOC105452593 [Wasmannia auropunctata]
MCARERTYGTGTSGATSTSVQYDEEIEARVRNDEPTVNRSPISSSIAMPHPSPCKIRYVLGTYILSSFATRLTSHTEVVIQASQWSFNFFLRVGPKHFCTIILNGTASLGNKRRIRRTSNR